jgi:hypothetical protein
VVRQHDPTRSDSNGARSRGDVSHHDGRRSARDPRHVVMLRQPKTFVAQPLYMLREIQGAMQRIGDGASLNHRGEIEDRKRNHALFCAALENLPAASRLQLECRGDAHRGLSF